MYILMQNVDRDREDKVRVLQSRSVIVSHCTVYTPQFLPLSFAKVKSTKSWQSLKKVREKEINSNRFESQALEFHNIDNLAEVCQ